MTFRSLNSSRRGQAAMLVTMTLVMTLGLLGFVVDFGWAYYRKLSAKAAAESAAISAALTASNKTPFCVTLATCQADTNCPADPPNPPVTNMDDGCLYAKKNGFQTAGNVTVAMAGGKTGSPVATVAPDYWVSATVTENVPQLFSRILGRTAATVKVRSTAGVFLHPANACIYSLAPAGTGFSVNGTITIQSGCGIYVDSTDGSSAMTGGGNSVIRASAINVVGGFSPNGGTDILPAPTTGAPVTTDPLAMRLAPDYSSASCSPAITETSVVTMPSTGIYKICSGGFTMNANKSLTIPGGTYVLAGGNIDWKNGTLRASGPVTFYLTESFGTVSVNGNIDVQLNAPPSGPLKGMLFFGDRTRTLTSVTFNGGSNMLLNGSLYFPTSDVKYSGGDATKNEYTALIAQHITFIGNSYFKNDIGGGFNGLGAPTTAFIE